MTLANKKRDAKKTQINIKIVYRSNIKSTLTLQRIAVKFLVNMYVLNYVKKLSPKIIHRLSTWPQASARTHAY